MTATAVTQHKAGSAIASMDPVDLRATLKNSLYPNATDASIDMVLGYCRAAGLDVMLKPVHIVPMWDSKAGKMRDVVMPGVGMYRVQASRSGEWAGVGEPEFGPMVHATIGGAAIEYPEWCRVTTRRLMRNGAIADFTAIEYWIENYAIKGGKEKSIAPNAMWAKRPRGQIAKCAQAQSLRLAFPEIGAAPTAEEMEGKAIDAGNEAGSHEVEARVAPTVRAGYPAKDFDANLPKWRAAILAGKVTAAEVIARVESKGTLSDAQMNAIRSEPADAGADVIDAEFTDARAAA